MRHRQVWLMVLGLSALVGGLVGGAWLLLTRDQNVQSTAAGAPSETGGSAPSVAQPAAPSPMPDTTPVAAALAESTRAGISASVPTTGRLTITGLPSGATLQIDGQRHTGTTFDLAGGPHVVAVSATGFEPKTDTVKVIGGRSITHRYAGRLLASRPPPAEQQETPAPVQTAPARPATVQPAVLVIRTTGGWARISVDGAFRREGTAHRDSLSPGTHTLRFEREGYVTVDTTVTLRAGETQVLTIRMRPRGEDGQ